MDEESKFDSNSSTSNNKQTDSESQGMLSRAGGGGVSKEMVHSYLRIIPYNKMYTKRILLDKGNFGAVYRIELDGDECALKICKIEMKEESALNRF